MSEYITSADNLVALNNIIPFNTVSIPCNNGNVVPVAPGVFILKGNTSNRFARYVVSLESNVLVPEGGEVTAVALGISLDGVALPESIAIYTPQAVSEYGHISTSVTITIPRGCCMTVSALYVDGTADDVAVTPTPSIQVRRNALLRVERIA